MIQYDEADGQESDAIQHFDTLFIHREQVFCIFFETKRFNNTIF